MRSAVLVLALLAAGCTAPAEPAPDVAMEATCRGATPCRACKSCKYCAHCAKKGGKCGVCKPPAE